ncbi:MAG: NAD(P)H-hydrate dehydratase [Myxococcales bacterium]|nr:NAD(P)H-hydrate dehydratase [Myxococcales bacterium]MCB9531269.1 NAD(P)H-hydrate dehydratase [Myxococcales bacterium]
MRVVDSAQMRALDRDAIDRFGIAGIVLMERAALATAAHIDSACPRGAVAVLVGPGNNGGDGSAVARLLFDRHRSVSIVLAADPSRLTGDARTQLDTAMRIGIPIVPGDAHDTVSAVLRGADVWVDALLGIGQVAGPRGLVATVLATAATVGRPPFTVAIDVPTGVDADTGRVFEAVVRADVTVTFEHAKWGCLLPPAREFVGRLVVEPIGIPAAATAGTAGSLGAWIDAAQAAELAPPLRATDHKGARGHVLVVGGAPQTTGAGVLAAHAALRAGAGTVTLCAAGRPAALAPEIMLDDGDARRRLHAARQICVVLGPGLGGGAEAVELLEAWLAAAPDTGRFVLDADALRLIAERPFRLPPDTILTPHPGELAALVGADTDEVVGDLRAAAAQAAEKWQCTVIAKTAGALVVRGGARAWVEPGHAGMATAGTGDVLAGVCGALLARMPDAGGAERAAIVGAWLHAEAGRLAGARRGVAGLIASDIVDALGDAGRTLER